MKQYLILLLLSILPIVASAEVDNGYTIDNWRYEAKIHDNNVWDVKETMTVNYLEPRHGIYRHIPRRFVQQRATNGGYASFTYMSSVDSITVTGYDFTSYDNDDKQDNIVIRIGNEDELLTGTHTYTITYRLTYPDDRYEASDEIYHTLMGPDCTTTIAQYSFFLHFDNELPANLTSQLHCFSGDWGSTGNALGVAARATRHEISGNVSNIAPGNGITIQADLPEGFWKDPESVNTMWYYVFLAITTVLFLLCMGYLIFHRRYTPLRVIEYSAPEGISSAEVGVIIDNTADTSDLNSLIVWFASKGYLKIRETEDKKDSDIELTKLRDLPKDAPKYQQLFWKVFFEKQDSVLLSKLGDRHELISKAQLALARHFHGKTALTHTHISSVITFFLFVIFGTMTLMTSSCVTSLEEDTCLFALFLWATPVIMACILRIIMSNYDMITKLRWRLLQYIIILLLGMISVAAFYLFFWNQYDSFMTLPVAAGVIMSGWIAALFGGRMLRDSTYRLEKMSLLLGFKEFIEKSELPMLKAQVDENPSYFFDVLPYAMVFGLTKKWQKKFKEIDMQAPDWYQTSSSTPLTALMASEHINRAMSHSISNSISIASHDPNVGGGGSHGGFVGGGGGGGGVGSW